MALARALTLLLLVGLSSRCDGQLCTHLVNNCEDKAAANYDNGVADLGSSRDSYSVQVKQKQTSVFIYLLW